MVGMACDFFRRHFGWNVFVIHLLYRIFKGKLKIKGHHQFQLGLFMDILRNLVRIKAGMGVEIIDFLAFCQFIP